MRKIIFIREAINNRVNKEDDSLKFLFSSSANRFFCCSLAKPSSSKNKKKSISSLSFFFTFTTFFLLLLLLFEVFVSDHFFCCSSISFIRCKIPPLFFGEFDLPLLFSFKISFKAKEFFLFDHLRSISSLRRCSISSSINRCSCSLSNRCFCQSFLRFSFFCNEFFCRYYFIDLKCNFNIFI